MELYAKLKYKSFKSLILLNYFVKYEEEYVEMINEVEIALINRKINKKKGLFWFIMLIISIFTFIFKPSDVPPGIIILYLFISYSFTPKSYSIDYFKNNQRVTNNQMLVAGILTALIILIYSLFSY